jgi:hypothetical protein
MAQGKSPDAHLITKADGSPWVNEKGKPSYVRWGRGMRAAVREANRTLGPEDGGYQGSIAREASARVVGLGSVGRNPAPVFLRRLPS